jgi:hypothetical protein
VHRDVSSREAKEGDGAGSGVRSDGWLRIRAVMVRIDLYLLLPPSNKICNYGMRVSQIDSSLTKFIVNNINIYVSNKFIIKIYSITNLIILILYHKY